MSKEGFDKGKPGTNRDNLKLLGGATQPNIMMAQRKVDITEE